MTASLSPRVEPAAVVELVGLVHQQLHRLLQEQPDGTASLPAVVYLLEGALKGLLRDEVPIYGVLDARVVARARQSVWVGRRIDMTEAFRRLNPTFGVRVDHGCWDLVPEQRQRHAAAQRREMVLSLGDRAADLLDPPAEAVGVAG